VVPIYGGQFRIVQPEVVLADVRQQVAAGARHITFGDPDFLNGPRHAMGIVRALVAEFPELTYDVTIKVEHLLRHADTLPILRDTGCLFVTSAVESLDDRVLALLDKGHTRADFLRLVERCREADLTLNPTFVAFHPWTTLDGYIDLLETIDRLGLVEHVAPIQLGIRLLVTEGSRLLELSEVRRVLRPYDAATLAYPWQHPDARLDDLGRRVGAIVEHLSGAPRRTVFDRIVAAVEEAAGRPVARAGTQAGVMPRAAVPYLDEPWYC
jgi:hypothetical protein